MSFEVDKALVNAYKANIDILSQQRLARIRPRVRVETQHSEYEYYDRVSATSAVESLNRHGDTPLISTPHDRRRVGLRDFDWADLIDRKDKLRMLADPTSTYVRNAIMAFNRTQDDLLIEAAFATAYSGKNGETSVTFPAGNIIAVNYHETTPADSNLTIGKLRRARYLLDKGEAAPDDEADLTCVVDPSQIQALLRTAEVTSADYNQIRALVDGAVDTFMGFKFIKSNRLVLASGNVRQCIAFERQGMLLAVGDEIMVDVGPRRDKRNSVQVYVCMSMGATRMEEAKVLQILCDEDL